MGNSKDRQRGTQKHQFCTFQLAERLFGIDILDVKEITQESQYTTIFHGSKQVQGYVNIRGQIHLVLNMRQMMGFERRELDPENRIIIFKPGVGESFGILVDRIGDVVEVEDGTIEERRNDKQAVADGQERRSTSLGLGVCQLEHNVMVLLDARRFLSTMKKNRQELAVI